MLCTLLPFSRMCSTPSVLTAAQTYAPFVFVYSTLARLTGTQAMSTSPLMTDALTAVGSPASVKAYVLDVSPFAALSIRDASPMPVGPFSVTTL